MRTGIGIFWRIVLFLLVPVSTFAQMPNQAADPVPEAWKPIEQVSTYAITGDSGVDLYASIGQHGPKVGMAVRAIAHTNFKLTWTRKYEPQSDGSCMITTARPRLIITYTLPKPASKLPADLQKKWEVFIAGVKKHEKVHAVMITDMVKEIERVSFGLRVEDDQKCAKIRTALQAKLGEISKNQRQRSADFDRMELSDGGNVHQLILQLVNGQ